MARFDANCVFDTTLAADVAPTNNVLFDVPVNTVELTETFTDEFPMNNEVAVKFAAPVLFAITVEVAVDTEFTVELPTNIVVVFAITLAPALNPDDVTLPTTVSTSPKRTFAEILAVPVTVRTASGVELFIPTRLESPLATSKLVLTTKPFLTTKFVSAILVPFPPRLYFLLFIH